MVAFLNARIPLAVWSVNRAEGASMIVLHPTDANGYRLKPGDSMVYAETLCSRMVAGSAPLSGKLPVVVCFSFGLQDVPDGLEQPVRVKKTPIPGGPLH